MPVIRKPSYLLKGKIRSQCRYTVSILQRVIAAYYASEEYLPIATGVTTGDCPALYYDAIITQLKAGLLEKG